MRARERIAWTMVTVSVASLIGIGAVVLAVQIGVMRDLAVRVASLERSECVCWTDAPDPH